MNRKFWLSSMLPIYVCCFVFLLFIAALGSKAVTVMIENIPLSNRRCVIIDAGHGGVDGGATSCTGVLESNINLEISLRLNDLMHLLGFKTLMIRTDDRSIHTSGNTIAQKKVSDLKERVRIANNTDNAFLISIHQNYYPQSQYYGPQVFYASGDSSRSCAQRMQKLLVESLSPDCNRKTKPAKNVYLMEKIAIDGVLIECGFLSNPEEESKLRNPDYQKKLCCTIACAYAVDRNQVGIS